MVDLDPLLDALKRPQTALLLVGEKGRGKTTHLLALLPHFPQAHYCYLPEDERPARRPPGRGPLFVDEAQRLPRRFRSRWFGPRPVLAIASHEDHSEELERAGWQVVHHRVGGLTVDRLSQIVDRRIQWARRRPGPTPEVAPTVLAGLLRRHGDNLRRIEDELYDLFMCLEEPLRVDL